jgi:hypothetical protein
MMEQPSSAMKAHARQVLTNDAKKLGYTKNEIELWKNIGNPDLLTDLLRSGASRISVPMAVGTGGIGRAASASALSTLARNAANKIQSSASDNLKKEIIQNYLGTPQNKAMTDLLRSLPAEASAQSLVFSSGEKDLSERKNIPTIRIYNTRGE